MTFWMPKIATKFDCERTSDLSSAALSFGLGVPLANVRSDYVDRRLIVSVLNEKTSGFSVDLQKS
jgi:hypothetical protein